MEISWTAKEIRLRLDPEGASLGRSPLEASVFTAYSAEPKQRFVQELCGMLGGEVVYLESVDPDGRTRQTVPACNWRVPGVLPYLDCIADFVNTALTVGLGVRAYGADRRSKWRLAVSSITDTADLDERSDRGSGRPPQATAVTEPNGMRTEF